MKKVVLPLLMLSLTCVSMRAQETEESTGTGANDFKKSSIELGFGFAKAANPMTSGYHMKTTNLFDANLGFRYMFSTKFGLKLTGFYDKFKEDLGPEFETSAYGGTLEGVVNLGRIMQFETWTKSFNVLGHLGGGVTMLKNDDYDLDDDVLGTIVFGLTAQYKIGNFGAVQADFSMLNNFGQQRTWDGAEYDAMGKQGFDSSLYHATLGLAIYLGQKGQPHADWYVDEKPDAIEEAESRIEELETMMNDTDKDGVPDYLDAEPNSVAGVKVDSKGRSIDTNNNGIPDEMESYVEQKTTEMKQAMNADMASLINGGYVNVYFDFNKEQPNAQSVGGINFLIKYLKENTSASADVIGYADEIGDTEYNRALSQRRAENVKKILVDAGIDAGRLNIVGNGEDTSVNKESQYARQTVRRVTFILK